MDARLSPVSSSSASSDLEDELFEGEQISLDEPQQPLSPPPEHASSSSRPAGPSGSNKRRAPGGPAGQPSVKSRSRRGEDAKSFNQGSQDRERDSRGDHHSHRGGRGPGPDGRREDLLDADYVKYLRRSTLMTKA